MKKQTDSKVSRASKISAVEKSQIETEESKFSSVLRRQEVPTFTKPIDLFIKYLKIEAVATDFESDRQENEVLMLVMAEFQKMTDGQTTTEEGIENLGRILTNDNIKVFRDAISKTVARLRKAVQKYSFVLPKEELWLHKTGKVLKGDVLRPCFVTNEAFGQIKDSKKGEMTKPHLFKDMEVVLESKEEALAKAKANGDKGAKKLAWPDKSDIKDCNFRVVFVDPKEKKTAIYCKIEPTAQALRNNAIVRRVMDKNKNIAARVGTLKTLWKCKKAEWFYRTKIRRFFGDEGLSEKLTDDHKRLTGMLDAYLQENYPNLYASGAEPQGVFSFVNKSHFNATNKRGEEGEPDEAVQEVIKRQFATLVNPELYAKPDSTQISANKKRIGLKSPFQEFHQPVQIVDKQVIDRINLFKIDARPGSFNHPELRPLFENYTQNSKILLKLHRLFVENVFNRVDFPHQGNEIDEMVFTVDAMIEKGNSESRATAFVNQVTDTYLALNLTNSFKADFPAMRFIKIRITERGTGSVVFDDVISLQEKLDTLFLENFIHHEVTIQYRGNQLKALLTFMVVLVPKNLETAHALLSKTLLGGSFDRFDLIIKKSDTYQDFSALLFTPDFAKVIKGEEFDFFSYFDQSCPFPSNTLTRQQNQFLRSFRTFGLDELKDKLKALVNQDIHLNQLLLETISKTRAEEKLGGSLCQDILIRTIDCLSVKERFFVNQLNFSFYHSMFINTAPKHSAFGFTKPVVVALDEALSAYFGQHPHLRFSHRALIHRLTFQTYLYFENNHLTKAGYRINFQKLYIPIIAHAVQANGLFLDPHQLFLLSAHTIFSTMFLQNYSDENHIVYLDSLLILFKLTFKLLNPDQYAFLRNFAGDFETLVLGHLANSFASLFAPTTFWAYQDFKQMLHLLVTIKQKNIPIMQQLNALELNFCSVVDVLFVLAVLVKNNAFLRAQATSKNFAVLIPNLLQKEALNLKDVSLKIMEMLDYCSDRSFFVDRFNQHKEAIGRKNLERASSVRSIYLNVKSLKIDSKVVAKMIGEEVEKNAPMKAKLQSLFVKEEPNNISSKASVEARGQLDIEYLNQDIFFETFEGIEEFQAEGEVEERVSGLSPEVAALVYLNNLDYGLIKEAGLVLESKANFNNISELNGDELALLLSKYVSGSQILKMEVFQDVAKLGDGKAAPLLRLLVVLAVTCTDNIDTVKKLLTSLAKALSLAIFPDDPDKILNGIIHFVVEELYNVLPVSSMPMFLAQKVNLIEKDLQIILKEATIELKDELIDVTELCMKHFLTNTFIHRRPSILFGRHFCIDLILILEDMLRRGVLDTTVGRFELSVTILRNGQPEYFQFPFLMEAGEKIAIVCKYTDTIFFNNKISSQNLVTERSLERVVDDCAFLILSNPVSFKLNLTHLDRTFLFKLRKFDMQLDVSVTFSEGKSAPVIANAITWNYKTEDQAKKTKFDVTEISLDVDYYCFFMKIEDFIKLVIHRSLAKLGPADFARLLRMNNEHYELTSNTNKSVDPRNYFHDLAEFERSMSRAQPLVLTVSFIERG